MQVRFTRLVPILVLLCATQIEASDQVSPTVDIQISGTDVSSYGTVTYYCGTLFTQCSVDVDHKLSDIASGGASIGHLATYYVSSGSTQRVYDNTLELAGSPAGHCFRASLSGIGSEGSDQRVSSGSPCIPYNPPSPPPPEYTACVTGNAECQDPLVLDLNGDGIHTTTSAQYVWFDMDGDGTLERITWTNPSTKEGFLYLDLDHKGRATNGRELFGVGTVMPDGSRGRDGFAALAAYDDITQGGNNDGTIDAKDAVWNRLRLWIDTNHDGVCDPGETGPIHAYGVHEIDVTAIAMNVIDDSGNLHQFGSSYRRRAAAGNADHDRTYAIHAIAFRQLH